jgi:hypothetical protein
MRLPRETNTILLMVFLGLLAASLWIYHDATTRGERFEGGQKLLPSLDIDRIAAIRLQKGGGEGGAGSAGEGTTLALRRSGDEFVLTEANGYPAKNEAVNRLLQDLLEITLVQEVGASQAEALGLDPPGEETLDIILQENTGDPMLHLRIGKAGPDGGNYLQRLDGDDHPIYLTERSLFLEPDVDAYLKKQILSIDRGEIQAIQGPDFRLALNAAGEAPLDLVEPAGATAKAGPLGRLRSLVSPLRFDQVYLADEAEVQGLVFTQRFEIALEGLGYRIEVAESPAGATDAEDRTFFRVSGFSDVERIEINPEDTEEELEGTADFLTRLDDLEEFNRFHGSWVYEATGTTAETLRTTRAELVE